MGYSSKTKRPTDLMFILGLKVTIDHLAIAHNVRLCGHVSRLEKGIRF